MLGSKTKPRASPQLNSSTPTTEPLPWYKSPGHYSTRIAHVIYRVLGYPGPTSRRHTWVAIKEASLAHFPPNGLLKGCPVCVCDANQSLQYSYEKGKAYRLWQVASQVSQDGPSPASWS